TWRNRAVRPRRRRRSKREDRELVVLGLEILPLEVQPRGGRHHELAVEIDTVGEGLARVLGHKGGEGRIADKLDEADLLVGVVEVEGLDVELDAVVEEPVLRAYHVGGPQLRFLRGTARRAVIEPARLEAGADVRIEQVLLAGVELDAGLPVHLLPGAVPDNHDGSRAGFDRWKDRVRTDERRQRIAAAVRGLLLVGV